MRLLSEVILGFLSTLWNKLFPVRTPAQEELDSETKVDQEPIADVDADLSKFVLK